MDIGTSSAELVEDKKKAKYGMQYLGALSACMGALCFGITLGYSSPAGEWLMEANSTTDKIALTEDENTWFSSIVNVGAAIGGPVGGLLINIIGRKGSCLTSAAVWFLGWILLVFAVNFAMLLAARIIAGLAMGITCIAVNAYVGEIASVEIRGMLGAGFQLMVVVGVEYAYVFGAIMTTWRTLAIVCIVPVVIFFVMMFIEKESPAYLLGKGREKEAAASLQYFRGPDYDIQGELNLAKESLEEAVRNKVSVKDLFATSYLLKPLLISLALMFFQQFSGINAVVFNLNTIFNEAGTSMSEDVSSIIVGFLQIVATTTASQLVDRAGRKILLISSAGMMAVSLVTLGVFFYVKEFGNAGSIGWLPLVSLIVYIMAFSLGFGPIPWLMMSELFPKSVVGPASGISTMFNWSMSFVCTFIFAPLKDSIGDYGVYWMFAGICLAALVFCVLICPETKGKTIEEISAYFGAPSPSANTEDKSANNEGINMEDISVIS